MKKYGPLIIFATIFFIAANVFQPADPNAAGIAVLKALGIMFAAGIGIILIFLYAPKVGLPSLPSLSTKLTPQRREVVGTLTLFALFLITFSYAFGDSWNRVFEWWKGSQMAIPLIFAVIGVILFANCEWRKKINKGLIALVGILIAGTLAINALIGWWEGREKSPASTIANTPPSIPQPVVVVTLGSPSPQEESVEREVEREDTVIAEYGVFTKVEFPPMKELVKFRWVDAPDGCVVAVYSDDAPDGEKFPCDSTIKNLGNIRKIGFASDIPGVSLRIPIQYSYRPKEV